MIRVALRGVLCALALLVGLFGAACCPDTRHFFSSVLAGTYDSGAVPTPDACAPVTWTPSGGAVLVISDDRTSVVETFTRDNRAYRVEYRVDRIDR